MRVRIKSADEFLQVVQLLETGPVRLILLLILWWFLHHLFAGLRVLLLDVEIGSSLKAARTSAIVVLVLDALLLVGGVWLL